ncbi:hypothetical protein EON82_09240 [bacterium]|nr:MAG: hypothetical protein EON82_09240 [bacterium]
MKNIVSAVFDTQAHAEQAISQLRASGVPDSAISVVAQHAGDMNTGAAHTTDVSDHHDDKASGTMKGLTIGAGVGALFGLAALAIPGVGPFVTAGALANVLGTTGGAIVAGAAVGGTAGSLAGALMDYGVNEEDARYYESRVTQGGVFVAVETGGDMQNEQTIRQVLQTAGGKTSAYMS